LDRDISAFKKAKALSEKYPEQIIACHGKFSDLPDILIKQDISPNSIDGILFDFGCSSMQLDDPERGFSLSKSGPLDMRMDRDLNDDTPTAADVIAHADEEDLIKIFKIYGQEKKARKIARAIVEARYIFPPIKTTSELKELIASACSNEFRRDKLQRPSHVATKVFQALRIFVNDELNEINFGILQAHKLLKIGGRLVTLCFHSLEDTIVKRHLTGNLINNSINLSPLKYASYNLVHDLETMKQMQRMKWTPLTKHVVIPTEEEVSLNPRSRSAKLRAALKNVD
jgi:receptor-type tyrosine-protein phosphatase gamma